MQFAPTELAAALGYVHGFNDVSYQGLHGEGSEYTSQNLLGDLYGTDTDDYDDEIFDAYSAGYDAGWDKAGKAVMS